MPTNTLVLHEVKRPHVIVRVYGNRVEIVERPGCLGFLRGSKVRAVPFRNISTVDVNRMTETLVIATNDSRRYTVRLGGAGGTATKLRDAIMGLI